MQFETVVTLTGCVAVGAVIVVNALSQSEDDQGPSRIESRYYEERVAARQRSDDYLAEHQYQLLQESQRKEITINVIPEHIEG